MINYSDKILDAKYYKKTKTKTYEVYVCKPKDGTEVVANESQRIIKTTAKEPFIIKEPSGRYRVTSEKEIANKYKFMRNKEITHEDIVHRCSKEGTMMWKHMQSNKFGEEVFYINVPVNVRFTVTVCGRQLVVNSMYCEHGNGDYVVCDSVLDKPDFSTIRVVNGLDFIHTHSIKLACYGYSKYRIGTAKPTWDFVNGRPIYNGRRNMVHVSLSSNNETVVNAIKYYFRPSVNSDNTLEINYGEMRYRMDLIKVNGERQIRVRKTNMRLNTTKGTRFLNVDDKLITNIEKMMERDS